MRLALLRHTAVAIGPGTCYGRLDLDLAATAAEDIAAVSARLGGFGAARLWSSPALRCRRLAAAVAASTGSAPLFDDRLLELDLGAWEGRPWEEVPRGELDRWAADPRGFAAPGGETGAALIERVTAVFAEIVASPGDHVVVTHGGPLRVLRALVRRCEIDLMAPAPSLGSVEIVEL